MKSEDILRVSYELRRLGFSSIEVSDMRTHLLTAHTELARILQDPTARKIFTISAEKYERDELGEPYEIGILERSGRVKQESEKGLFDRAAGREYDDPNKEMFHYSPALLQVLSADHRREYLAFLTALAEINSQAVCIVRHVVREIGKKHRSGLPGRPCRSLEDLLDGSTAITRLIEYGSVDGGVLDAQVHRDRDFVTVHHYSSEPGLYVFDKERNSYQTPEQATNVATVFTGEKFWGRTRGKYGAATPHGVYRNCRNRNVISTEKRFVAVTFVHSRLTRKDTEWIQDNLDKIGINQSQYKIA